MLSAIERKLTAIVSDGLTTRTHLNVVEPPADIQPGSAGRGVIRVSLTDVTPEAVFNPAETSLGGTGTSPVSRRVLPLHFAALLEFRMTPATGTVESLAAARDLLLTDMSLAAHILSAGEVRNGKAFSIAAPDPGFNIVKFDLEKGSVLRETAFQLLTAELRYKGMAEIWPPNVTRDEGVIAAVDPVIASLPMQIVPERRSVQAGGTARVRVRSTNGSRLLDSVAGTRAALRLAVRVLSDVPPDQRGAIVGGSAGAETGLRIIETTLPETIFEYLAPAGPLTSPRFEYVAVHFARPDNLSGVFLGSTPIQLIPGSS
jgi:hypothetical protein